MRLLLIRHGETVDNIAGLYAGVRDSALTVHGALQARKLASYLAKHGYQFKQIFSSDLQRASKTAAEIRKCQVEALPGQEDQVAPVLRLPILREQDFGSYEGKRFYERQMGSKQPDKNVHGNQHLDGSNFRDVESKESMSKRMDAFIDEHLLPAIFEPTDPQDRDIAVVSHGIIMSMLWKCFLGRFSKNSVRLAPDVRVGQGPVHSLEHPGGWSNTGYLELLFNSTGQVSQAPECVSAQSIRDENDMQIAGADQKSLAGRRMTIMAVNGKEHLRGFKRTGGGVGSSQYDDSQKSIDTFFKKRRVEQQ